MLRRIFANFALSWAFAALSVANAGGDPGSDDIDALFARFDALAPGCAVGVMKDGALIHAKGYGYADVEKKIPITAHTAFDIASLSKSFTAMSILLLEQRGSVTLDDSIRKYVPELGTYADAITLRNLLHHTGGLGDYVEVLPLLGVRPTDAADGATTLSALSRLAAPNGPPGVYYDYSNTGYFLLGLVIERAGGRPLDDFVKENIFEPLGMRLSGFVGNYADAAAFAQGYRRDENGGFEKERSPWLQRGAGQLITTLRDFAKWDENLYTGKVGGSALIAKLKEAGRLADGTPINYGGGLKLLRYRGLRSINHSGIWLGFHADYRQFPDLHLSVVVMCNRVDTAPWRYTLQVADLYLRDHADAGLAFDGAQLSGIEGAGPPQKMPTGTYRDVWTGRYVQLHRKGSGLVLQDADVSSSIRKAAGQVYKTTQSVYNDEIDTYLVFRPRHDDAQPRIFSMSFGAPAAYTFVAPWVPKHLGPYVGDYSNQALGLTFRIRQTQDGLTLTTNAAEATPLTPVSRGEFRSPTSTLRFAPCGSLDGFMLDTPGARNIQFIRRTQEARR